MKVYEILQNVFDGHTKEFDAALARQCGSLDFVVHTKQNLAVVMDEKGDYKFGLASAAYLFTPRDAPIMAKLFSDKLKAMMLISEASNYFKQYAEEINCSLENTLHLARKNGVKFP